MGLQALPILLPLPIPLAVVAVASGVETALFSLTYHDRLRLKRLSPRAASAVTYLLARPRTLLVLVLFVTMAAATVYFVLTSLALMASESAVVKVIVAAVNLLLMTLVGEIVSKVLAARYRVEVCRLTAPWVLYAFRAVQPFLRLVEHGLVSPLVRVITPERKAERLTEEELDALLHQGSAEGAIDADERRVLGQVIRLSGLRVKDVMTHRVDMHWVEETATHAEVAALVRENRMTRLPVVAAGEDIDQGVLGLLDVKRYLAMVAAGSTTQANFSFPSPSFSPAPPAPTPPPSAPGLAEARPTAAGMRSGAPQDLTSGSTSLRSVPHGGAGGVRVTDAMDPVRYVPASASLDKLLDQFSSAGTKLGLVVDEHGGVVGIVSTENVVQRLIAELTSDEDLELESQVKQLPAPDGRWSVPGRLTVRDWATMFGLVGGSVEARVSTVAGLIFAKLGRVPRVGDVVMVGNLRLEVMSLVPGEHGSAGRVVASAAVSIVENGAGHAGRTGGGGA